MPHMIDSTEKRSNARRGPVHVGVASKQLSQQHEGYCLSAQQIPSVDRELSIKPLDILFISL